MGYKRTHNFDVHFFPESSERMRERAFEIGESLYNVLNYIQVNEALYRGIGMKMKYFDGVLHFFVNYDFHVFKPVEEPVMEKLFHKEALKHERINVRNKGS